RAAIEVDRGDRVHDPVAAYLFRVVHPDRDAGAHAWLYDQRRDVAVVALEHLAHLMQHRRHRRAQRDPGDIGILQHAALPSRPCSTTASSSAVRRGPVAMRQCSTTCSPSNTPSTVLVFPTSIVSSMAFPRLYAPHPLQ